MELSPPLLEGELGELLARHGSSGSESGWGGVAIDVALLASEVWPFKKCQVAAWLQLTG
jgi:hypothetical protein